MVQMRPDSINFRARVSPALAALAMAVTVAGCGGLGGAKTQEAAPALDPNAFPANYRTQITAFLRQSITQRADFRGALIAPPALKPIGNSQHYMVCVQFNGNAQIKTKIAVYLGGQITQFIDATPEQCGDAAYQPFKELEAALPPAG